MDQKRQRRIQSEIDEIFCEATEEFDIDSVGHLPYLDACFREALRIMPPGPFGNSMSSVRLNVADLCMFKVHQGQRVRLVPEF